MIKMEPIKERLHNYCKWNTGFSILKIWMGMAIVICHFHDADLVDNILVTRLILRWGGYGVPIFVLIAFLITDHEKMARDNQRVRNRFERLLIPHAFFSISTWLLYFFLNRFCNANIDIGFSNLIWQLAFGSDVNAPLWFWISIIVVTGFIIIAMRISNRKVRLFVVMFEGISAFVMQYTGLNYFLFCNLDYRMKWTVGRILELLPYAVVGTLICSFKLNQFIEQHRYGFLCSFFVIYFICSRIPFPECNGFYYQGFPMMVKVTLLVLIFYCIPFDKVPYYINGAVNIFSKYTMGIIAIHYPVKTLMDMIIWNNEHILLSFSWGVLHYFICFILVYIGSIIPNKLVQRAFV